MKREQQKSLFAVVFEVQLNPQHADEYVRIATELRSQLVQIEGFIENERFRSRTRDHALLSLSFWESEKALVRWRSNAAHHQAQARGRAGVFDNYHLRVAEVTRATGRFADCELGWMRQDTTQVGEAIALTLIDETSNTPLDHERIRLETGKALEVEIYEHLDDSMRTLTVISWATARQADEFFDDALRADVSARRQLYSLRVIRDYGLADRREAPQFYPPCAGA